MGWKPKNEPNAPACVRSVIETSPTTELPWEVRNVELNTDAILDCLAYACRLEGETGNAWPEEFANTVNRLTDEQVRVFTQRYEITPATRQGIILWNDNQGEGEEDEENY